MFCIEQIFKDNEHYNDVFGFVGNIFVDSLKWLFSDKTLDGKNNDDYCLKDYIETPNFMSVVKYFIGAATLNHPEQTIKEYIKQMKEDMTGKHTCRSSNDIIRLHLVKNKPCIIFASIAYGLIDVSLWSAHIFWLLDSELHNEDEESKKRALLFLDILKENTCLNDEGFKEHFLMTQTFPTMKEAIRLFFLYEKRKEMNQTKEAIKNNNVKTLEQYLQDPIYEKCFNAIVEELYDSIRVDGCAYDENDYVNMLAEVETLVKRVLETKQTLQPIEIGRIITELNTRYGDSPIQNGQISARLLTKEKVIAILLEMCFLVVLWDKMVKKTDLVRTIFKNSSIYIKSHDNRHVYLGSPLWEILKEKVDSPQKQSVSQVERIEGMVSLSKYNELKKRLEDLQEKFDEDDAELKEYKQGKPEVAPHNKVRLELAFKLFDRAGADYTKKHGNKARAARLAEYLTGINVNKCEQHLVDRSLNHKFHEKEILNANFSLWI